MVTWCVLDCVQASGKLITSILWRNVVGSQRIYFNEENRSTDSLSKMPKSFYDADIDCCWKYVDGCRTFPYFLSLNWCNVTPISCSDNGCHVPRGFNYTSQSGRVRAEIADDIWRHRRANIDGSSSSIRTDINERRRTSNSSKTIA